MPWMLPAAIFGSSLLGSRAASSAADTQAAAANRAADLQQKQFEQTRADLEPWRKAGVNALGKLEGMADYTMFGPEQFSADPGYGFRLAEGRKALASKARARGGLVSGTSLKAMQDYAQESASNEFSNAFNRYQIERAAKLGPYQSLAQVGQTTANQLGGFGAANAANVGNLMTSGAAAQAAGQVGASNAITGGLGTYLNYTSSNNLLNALQRNQDMQLVNSGGFTNTPRYMVNPQLGET